jgi:NTE family protein
MKNAKIAIACQGGGSETAFTAGVLKSFFENDLHRKKEIVSLTGTSGGAVCAVLAWYSLLRATQGDQTPIHHRIMAFWHELTAQSPPEVSFDGLLAEWMRLTDKGIVARFELSPASLLSQWSLTWLSSILPRHEFTDLRALLEKHIRFDELHSLTGPASPILLVGAVDVLTGDLKIFNSRDGEIRVEAILASAAVPSLFPAVQIGEHYYWDGLFSDNPPLKELIQPHRVGGERIPDEIWIIQINPTACKKVPSTPSEIIDRRNEMIGNVSLLQSVEFLEAINRMLKEKVLSDEALNRVGISKRDPVEIHFIQMSEDLRDNLDYVAKLTREPAHIKRLIEDGEKQGLAFLKKRAV